MGSISSLKMGKSEPMVHRELSALALTRLRLQAPQLSGIAFPLTVETSADLTREVATTGQVFSDFIWEPRFWRKVIGPVKCKKVGGR